MDKEILLFKLHIGFVGEERQKITGVKFFYKSGKKDIQGTPICYEITYTGYKEIDNFDQINAYEVWFDRSNRLCYRDHNEGLFSIYEKVMDADGEIKPIITSHMCDKLLE